MIWGKTLEPGKLYTETMGEEVQLSMAAMDSRKDHGGNSDDSFCQIMMKTSKGEYVLCTLIHGVMFQQNLDLKIMPREKVTFSVQGSSVVYLVGYTSTYPEDEDGFDDSEEDDLDDASGGFSAWEAFEPGDPNPQEPVIKEEPVDMPDDPPRPMHPQQEGRTPSQQQLEGKPPLQQPEGTSAEPMDGETKGRQQEEEIIFSVADVGTGASHSQSTLSPQIDSQDNLYGVEAADDGTMIPQAGTESEYFYPETKQQPDLPPTPIPDSYPPTQTAANFTQGDPQGVFPPPTEHLMRSHVGPIRHPAGRGRRPRNTQRTYPPQRPQHGLDQGQPAGTSLLATPEIEISVSEQQESMPGPSYQDNPGPSMAGPSASGPDLMEQVLQVGAAGGSQSLKQQPRSSVREWLDLAPLKLVCRVCGKRFESVTRYRKHALYHQMAGKFQCQYCSKRFNTKGDCTQHERTHTGEKPYKCSICGKGFGRAFSRKRHEKTHGPVAS